LPDHFLAFGKPARQLAGVNQDDNQYVAPQRNPEKIEQNLIMKKTRKWRHDYKKNQGNNKNLCLI
jgi:hypothetical protein